jgi:hypothetical protein
MEAKLEQQANLPVGTIVKLIVGVFFAAIGILQTFDNLGLMNALPYLRYWPLVLVAIGAIKFSANSGPIFGIILMVVGGWLLLYNLHWIHFTIFQLWPLVLIGFGVVTVARAFGWKPGGAVSAPAGGIWAILTSRNVVETSRDYQGGEVVAFLGGCRIDLTGAAIAGGPAVIDATAIWGGIEIVVPHGWEVVGEVIPIMAGFEIKSGPSVPRSGQLIVRGVALMGGIEVKGAGRMS